MTGQLTTTSFNIFLNGVPQSKGSIKAFVVGGRARLTSDNPKLKSWQSSMVQRVALVRPPTIPAGVPVYVRLIFVMPRPASRPSRIRQTLANWCVVKPDIDKLTRAVLDVLTQAGVYADDNQVVWSTQMNVEADPRWSGVGVLVRPLDADLTLVDGHVLDLLTKLQTK